MHSINRHGELTSVHWVSSQGIRGMSQLRKQTKASMMSGRPSASRLASLEVSVPEMERHQHADRTNDSSDFIT